MARLVPLVIFDLVNIFGIMGYIRGNESLASLGDDNLLARFTSLG